MRHKSFGLADQGGGKGRQRCVPPWGPNSLFFLQFSAKNLQNNSLAHPLWELAPPQENPGSAKMKWYTFSCLINFRTRNQTELRIPVQSAKHGHGTDGCTSIGSGTQSVVGGDRHDRGFPRRNLVIYIKYTLYLYRLAFLPAATKLWPRLCFYSCL